MSKIRVLVVDDSALVRRVLTEIFNADRELEVVGTAGDPYAARTKVKELDPDVITLDVEMPKMDGLSFLSNLMRLRPTPVVMVSSLTARGAEVTLEALELGAVDFVTKPQVDVASGLEAYAEDICAKVKVAALARQRPGWGTPRTKPKLVERHTADAVLPMREGPRALPTTEKLIVIGASTGGVEAIGQVLPNIPAVSPAILIALHIPGGFSAALARRLDGNCAIKITEGLDGEPVLPGHCYIAPGGRHMLLRREGARYYLALSDGPPVNRHRPSVDVLFRSVANHAGRNAVGALLTGMGDDGAAGLLEMREAGAPTFIQDQATSVVWGMPGSAWRIGAAQAAIPLNAIADILLTEALATTHAPSRNAASTPI